MYRISGITFAAWGWLEGEESKKLETYTKNNDRNFHNLVEEIDIQVQEVLGVPNKVNS